MEDAGFYSTISTPLARLMSRIKKTGHMESRNEIMGSELIRAWTQEYWGYRKNPAQPPSRAWLEPFLKVRQDKAGTPGVSGQQHRSLSPEGDAMDVDSRPPAIDLRTIQGKPPVSTPPNLDKEVAGSREKGREVEPMQVADRDERPAVLEKDPETARKEASRADSEDPPLPKPRVRKPAEKQKIVSPEYVDSGSDTPDPLKPPPKKPKLDKGKHTAPVPRYQSQEGRFEGTPGKYEVFKSGEPYLVPIESTPFPLTYAGLNLVNNTPLSDKERAVFELWMEWIEEHRPNLNPLQAPRKKFTPGAARIPWSVNTLPDGWVEKEVCSTCKKLLKKQNCDQSGGELKDKKDGEKDSLKDRSGAMKAGPSKKADSGKAKAGSGIQPPCIEDTVGRLERSMRQLEAQLDTMGLGLVHSSLVLVDTKDHVKKLVETNEETANRCGNKWVEMKEARASLLAAVGDLKKAGTTAAGSEPVMRLIKRHIQTCENLAKVVADISVTTIRVVGEMTASTNALAAALGHPGVPMEED
ncbi:hypothetical protein EST38_g11502 [Candolleomyces aberdarensis]|uniref:Uncharacterized protein n=1 Tax=Candolleomyces aberdarensis TaxID=2316362 RepID=A0A4Q2D7E7_9AGAR|nr:hypothetical protein EST38_g11502 [Candolleomyces aberdarensis]